MRPSPIRLALAAALAFPLACAPGSAPDGGLGVCGGSKAACTSAESCCTGFECSLGTCVFVGGGNNGNNNNGGSSTSAGGNSSGIGGSSSSGGLGSTGHGTSGGSTGLPSSSGGSNSGATSGFSPDLCASCESIGCSGPHDLCVCDPTDPFCESGAYCAGSCGTGQQALCPAGTDCISAMDPESGDEDFVCYPASGTCISVGTSGGSTGGGSSSGGSSGGAGGGICSICGIYTGSTTPTPGACTDGTNFCFCNVGDESCINGFCAVNCMSGGAADPSLCPVGTTCLMTADWQTASMTEFGCFPASGSCPDAGE